MHIPPVTDLSLREAAVVYARAGLYVGPWSLQDGKSPGYLLGKGWPEKTSNDPATVDGWFDGVGTETWHRKGPIDGIFLHVGRSGLVVFDVDNSDALPRWLLDALRKSKPARQFSNDSKKKFHCVYDAEGFDYGNSRGQLEEGWGDVRGRNGIIILQPSPHPKAHEGGRYRWDSRDVPPLPPVLAAKLKAAREPEPFDPVGGHGLADPVPHGARDETMHRYACSLRARNLDYDEALALMRVRAESFENADGRVNEAFLRQKLDNAWSYAPGTSAQQEQAGLSPDDEEIFWKSRPELTLIRDFARSRRVAPWAVLGVTLARVLRAVHHNYMIPPTIGSATSMNFFVAVCGGSGGGKSTAKSVSREVVRIDNEPLFAPIGSGEGIARAYMHMVKEEGPDGKPTKRMKHEQFCFSVMFEAEEIATLGAMFKRSGATLGETLRRGWDGKTLGYHYRSDETRLIVPEHSYRMCLWVGVQPDAAHILLDEEGLGTPQRFVWVAATDKNRPSEVPHQPEPMAWEPPPFPDDLDFVDNDSMPQLISICDTAVQAIIEAADAKLEDRSGMDGHLLLCQVKVAAALGLLSGHWGVSEDDWALAGQVMAHSNGVRASLVAFQHEKARRAQEAKTKVEGDRAIYVEEVKATQGVKRVAAKILKLVGESRGGLSRTELSRTLSSRDREFRDDALDLLSDRIKRVEEQTDSRHSEVRYVIRE